MKHGHSSWVMCKSREPRNDANVGTELFSLSMTEAEDEAEEYILSRNQGQSQTVGHLYKPMSLL